MCPSLCPRAALYHLLPPYVTQRGHERPLVTIEDYKGFFAAVRFTKPLLYQLSYAGAGLIWRSYRGGSKGMPEHCALEIFSLHLSIGMTDSSSVTPH